MRIKPTPLLLLLLFLLLFTACQPAPVATAAPLRSPQPATPISEPASTSVVPATQAPPVPSPVPTQTPAASAQASATAAPNAYKGIVLARVWIYADQSGWATDLQQTKVFHTFDAGKTWRDVSPALGRGTTNLFFLDGKTGWISQNISESNSYIWHSTDGGVKWLRFSQANPGGILSFSNTLNGFVLITMDAGMSHQSVEIQQTADGGATWVTRWKHLPEEAEASLPSSGNKNHMMVLDPNNLLLTGTWPVPKSLYAFQSDNSGYSWNQVQCAGIPELGSSDMWDAQAPLASTSGSLVLPVRAFASVGVDKTFFCTSTDRGRTWVFASQLDAAVLHSFTSSGAGLSAGANTLYRTEDGAQTWQPLPFNPPAGQAIIDLVLADSQNAYLLTNSLQTGPYAPAFLYASRDGGQTWVLLTSEIVN